MLDRLMTNHCPIGAERAFRNVMKRASLAHFLENGLPGVLVIDVTPAYVPLVRMVGPFFRMRFEIFLQRGEVRVQDPGQLRLVVNFLTSTDQVPARTLVLVLV